MIGEWTTALEATEVATALQFDLELSDNQCGAYLWRSASDRIGGATRSSPSRAVGLGAAGTALGSANTHRRHWPDCGDNFGTLLFITRATEYAASNLFIAKMILVLLGTANTLMLRMPAQAQVWQLASDQWKPSTRIRVAAGVSLAAWLSALTLGRVIGYF